MPAPTAPLPQQEHRLHADPARSYTLPSRVYIAPESFERERAAIFFRSWHYAGHGEDLRQAGSYVTTMVLDQNIVVIRGKDGALRAFYNVCKHRAHELLRGDADGRGRAKVITCPYHAWSYHSDGRLRSARGTETMAGFDAGEFCLTPVRVEAFGPLVFVNLDADAPSLASQAGALLDEVRRFVPEFDSLTRCYSRRFEIKANWKVVVDNFLECYHCEPAHPAFAQLIDMDSYRSTTHSIHSSHLSRAGRGDNKAYKFNADDRSQVGCFWYLWPTTTINCGPGEPNMTMFYMRPLGPDRTLQISDTYYLTPDMTERRRARAGYGSNVLQAEDNALCEAVQRGLAQRGYSQGRFIVDKGRTEISEHAVHHFHRLVAAALGD